MKLRFISLVSALLIILVIVSGCGGTQMQTQDSANPSQTITSTDSFLNSYKDWTTRLDRLAEQTKAAVKDWENKKIDTEVFITKSQDIYQAMKKLNDETDLMAEIQLSDSDKQKVNYDEVTNAYNKASKDLNDFLYQLPHTPDDKIKTKYNEMIEQKYTNDAVNLKKLLNM